MTWAERQRPVVGDGGVRDYPRVFRGGRSADVTAIHKIRVDGGERTRVIQDRIIVIGMATKADLYTLFVLSEWLEKNRPGLAVHERIQAYDRVEIFDMSHYPERGDALDAMGPDVKLVIALHLFAIDKIPGRNVAATTALEPGYCYNRNNIDLLKLCMKYGAVLIAVGDQPWLGLQRRARVFDPAHAQSHPEIWIYERFPEQGVGEVPPQGGKSRGGPANGGKRGSGKAAKHGKGSRAKA